MTPTESNERKPQTTLLTVTEAYTALRISRWSLYRLIQARRLESILIGRRRLVPEDAVQRFIEAQRAEGQA